VVQDHDVVSAVLFHRDDALLTPFAEGICSDAGIDRGAVLESLARLVDKSLVTAKDARFQMLETIRQYAWGKLVRSGERRALEVRHAGWYLDLAERGNRGLGGPDHIRWLARFAEEHDNFRAALEWARDHSHETYLRIAGALWRFWTARRYFREGFRWLEDAVASSEGAPGEVRALLLHGAGYIAAQVGDNASAEWMLRDAGREWQACGDLAQAAKALAFRRFIHDAGIARSAFEKAEGNSLERALLALSSEAFECARAEGESLSLDAAIEYAVGERGD
jgi:hypothetical protein